MPDNIVVIADAAKIRHWSRNYNWDDMPGPGGMAAGERGQAADQGVECFKEFDGTLRKNMRDASTDSLHPEGRVLITDAEGQADTTANLAFDGTDLTVGGNEVHHSGKSSIFLENGVHTAEFRLTSDGKLQIYIDDNYQTEWGGTF